MSPRSHNTNSTVSLITISLSDYNANSSMH